MSDLTTEIKKLEIETLDNLKLSKAKNTIRAYKSDLYARIVFLAFDNFKLSKVSISSFLISVVKSFIISDNH